MAHSGLKGRQALSQKGGYPLLRREFPSETSASSVTPSTLSSARFRNSQPHPAPLFQRPTASIISGMGTSCLLIFQRSMKARSSESSTQPSWLVSARWWEVTVVGVANHAGTTPMDRRQDALLAAASFIQAVNHTVTRVPGHQVGTVGRIEALPGSPNLIPGRVTMTLELRDLDAGKIAMLYEWVRAEALRIGRESRTTFQFEELSVNAPAPTHPRIRELITRAATQLGLSSKPMPSGAGHDAQNMARLGPVGMIFIPSVGGISHSPQERSHPRDVVNGANVLLHTVLALDREQLD